MKPAAFAYFAPETVDEAVELLAAHQPGARVLAGGQSLVPAMNFRLARPKVLVDINRLGGLGYLHDEGATVRIGALTRHLAFQGTTVADPLGGLLRTVVRHVGHLPIRVRGTFGGSIAHADPAAEWCLLAHTLDAEIDARSAAGVRTIAAADFFETVFTTALQPGEMITEVRLPTLGSQSVGFEEFSRRAGDFAIVMALTLLDVHDGVVVSARIGLGGVAGTPVRAREAEASLVGQEATAELYARAAEAAAAEVHPLEDIHGGVEYRRDLVRALTRRALVGSVAA